MFYLNAKFCRRSHVTPPKGPMFRIGWVVMFWLVVLSQALAGCDGLVGGSGDQLPDYVQDSGIGASVGAGGYFTNHPIVFGSYWLDNQTIMFAGYDGPALPMEQISSRSIPGRVGQYDTFLWSPEQPAQRHPTLSTGGTFYAAGRIRKTLPDGPNGEKRELIGPIDNPQIQSPPAQEWAPGKIGLNRFNPLECDYYRQPENMLIGNFIKLRKGDGFLDKNSMESLADMEERKRTGQYQQRRYLLRNDAGEVVKELPIPSKPNGATWFRYVEFKDAYFGYLWQPDRNRMGLHSTIAGEDWERLGCLKGYWLDRQGNVEEVCIPYGPWAPDFNVFTYPVKDGYIIIRKQVQHNTMYFTTGKVYRKLLEGDFSDISVSPDGSRIAFGHGPPLPLHMRQQKPYRSYKAPNVTFTSLKSIDLNQLDRNQFNPLPEVKHAD